MSTDPRTVLDSLVSDACDMQRMTGRIPRPQETRDEIVPIVDRLVKKQADQANSFQPEPEKRKRKPVEQIEAAYKNAGGIGSNVQLVTPENSTVIAPQKQTRAQRKDERMRRQRLRLLWSLPDWQDRIKNVDILAAQGFRGPEAKRQAEFQYTEILKASEEKFGPYWKPLRPRKHYSTGNGKRGAVQQ